jgi:MoaA/NifB/PqqE/SkfB family radical SAM enzyme
MKIARDAAAKAVAYGALALQGWGLTGDRALRGPLYAQISICDPCDHRCMMCPYHPPDEPTQLDYFGEQQPGIMSEATFRRLVDDLAELGTPRVDLVGRGEPLLHPRAAELVAYAKARGLAVAVTSNGSRLGAALAEKLVATGLDWLRVSLNAGRAETYPRIHVTETAQSYLRTRERIAALTAERRRARAPAPHVTLSFTITALNVDELTDMVEAVAAVGADAGHFQHVIDPGGPRPLALDDEQYARLLGAWIPAARERARALGIETNLSSFADTPAPDRCGPQAVVPCYVGSYFTVVLGNGAVMPCCQTKRPLGSLEDGGFKRTWNADGYRAFRRAARALPRPSPELATCECDRCYFRPHNLSVHRVLHALRAARAESSGLIAVTQLVRMSRLDHKG